LSDRRAGLSTRLVVLSTALVCGVVLAACSSTKGSATPPSSATTTTTIAAHGSTTLTTPTPSTTVAGCTGANYTLSLLGTQGAAGTNEVTFGFKNTSSVTCPLSGYPGIQLIGVHGIDIPTTTDRGGGLSFTNFVAATVSVGPGQTAYFNMAYSDVVTGGETSCPTTTALGVIPPNSTTSLQVPAQLMVCNSGTVTVSPVFGQGSPDTQTTAPPTA